MPQKNKHYNEWTRHQSGSGWGHAGTGHAGNHVHRHGWGWWRWDHLHLTSTSHHVWSWWGWRNGGCWWCPVRVAIYRDPANHSWDLFWTSWSWWGPRTHLMWRGESGHQIRGRQTDRCLRTGSYSYVSGTVSVCNRWAPRHYEITKLKKYRTSMSYKAQKDDLIIHTWYVIFFFFKQIFFGDPPILILSISHQVLFHGLFFFFFFFFFDPDKTQFFKFIVTAPVKICISSILHLYYCSHIHICLTN